MNLNDCYLKIKSMWLQYEKLTNSKLTTLKYRFSLNNGSMLTVYAGYIPNAPIKPGEFWLDMNNSILTQSNFTTPASIPEIKVIYIDTSYYGSETGQNIKVTTTKLPTTTKMPPDVLYNNINSYYEIIKNKLDTLKVQDSSIIYLIDKINTRVQSLIDYIKNKTPFILSESLSIQNYLIQERLSINTDIANLQASIIPTISNDILELQLNLAKITQTTVNSLPITTTIKPGSTTLRPTTIKPGSTTLRPTTTIKPSITTTSIPTPCMRYNEIKKPYYVALDNMILKYRNNTNVPDFSSDIALLSQKVSDIIKFAEENCCK